MSIHYQTIIFDGEACPECGGKKTLDWFTPPYHHGGGKWRSPIRLWETDCINDGVHWHCYCMECRHGWTREFNPFDHGITITESELSLSSCK